MNKKENKAWTVSHKTLSSDEEWFDMKRKKERKKKTHKYLYMEYNSQTTVHVQPDMETPQSLISINLKDNVAI